MRGVSRDLSPGDTPILYTGGIKRKLREIYVIMTILFYCFTLSNQLIDVFVDKGKTLFEFLCVGK